VTTSEGAARRDGEFPVTTRTTPSRRRDRVRHEVTPVHAVLDEALVCHLGFVVDGEPVVLPFLHTRLGENLYLHTSSGSRLTRSVPPEGLPVCLTVTLLDGLVLARSQFHHSLNYRSVVVHGRAHRVEDPEELVAALTALVEHVVPGRSAASRPGSARELAATAVLRVPLAEASLKARSGPPADDPADADLPYWAGVVPVSTVLGPPEPAPDLDPAVPLPDHVAGYRSR